MPTVLSSRYSRHRTKSQLKVTTCSLQVIETNSRVYLIMEVATGGDLLTVIQEQKRIPEKQSAIWFRQMCDAIDYCHQRGVVHRDLKCENLLLDHKVLLSTRYRCLVLHYTHLVWLTSQKTHRGGLGLSGPVHEEAHPCFPYFG